MAAYDRHDITTREGATVHEYVSRDGIVFAVSWSGPTLPDLKQSTILFGSHGLAVTDVAMAVRAYELAREHGIGTEIPL